MIGPPEEESEDAWPDEPTEFDPESLGPSVHVPESPAVSDFSEADVPDGLARAFWEVVLMANVGLFGVSIGVMFVVFLGDWETGIVAVAIGVLASVLGYRRYLLYTDDAHDASD